MKRKVAFFAVFALISTTTAFAQSLRIKSNSLNVLDVVVMGKNSAGEVTSSTIYNVYDGYDKLFNLYKLLYGCKVYDKNDAKGTSFDRNCTWTKIVVYNNSMSRRDTFDISHAGKGFLANANVKVKVKQEVERKHSVTYVTFND